ncbi:MAG: GGDEF domain-containing protein [Thiohalophilus sp.]|uniref:GGDEF domain-containing protein n=1 Tax=Thiohalophilus sp. TaxID=3028392 RepID=UPI00287052DF|nr:GGDEF domain-containing protein [Thiohalophilus sp.]MDR9435591.1 GGDEF domain-containing protein [Thiohalophilus sp.]
MPVSVTSTDSSALKPEPALLAEFVEIVEQSRFASLYQPIIDLEQQRIIGHEGLIRGPSASVFHNPQSLFEFASQWGHLSELDLACRQFIIEQFHRLMLRGKLFINCAPAVLLDADHPHGKTLASLRRLGISPESVVIELTEQHPLDDYELLREALHYYRSMGFEIAIDDFGAGYAGLRMWSELRPDYVKIDRHFIQGINEDPVKKEFVRSILDIARGLECKVIAEGIETQEEYRTICDMGIILGQGYYFARPAPTPVTSIEHLLCDCVRGGAVRMGIARLSETVASILRNVPSLPPSASLDQVVDLFHSTSSLHSLPIIDEQNHPVGMVRRSKLMDIYASSRYGRELYGRKPIARFMDQDPVVVEQNMRIEEVSQLVTDSMQVRLEDDFIITEGQKLLGIGRVVDLLRKITDLQIRNARYANPLTLLPGNVPIYELLDDLIRQKATFAVAYCDLDNFKPFNDVYGYAAGDEVLQCLATVMVEQTDAKQDFVGHIGGDDFILILQSDDWQKICSNIQQDFHSRVPRFYSVDDQQAAGIRARNRQGQESFFPLLTVSIGLVLPDIEYCYSHHDIAAMATAAKREAKALQGSRIFVDRRRRPGS